MDLQGSGFLKGMASFGFRSSPAPDLSVKDKRYLALVEKALASFDSLDEWADYIAFLSRLQKALALSEDTKGTLSWIPAAERVLSKLALCLSPKLPNGVHQRALALYDLIFTSLTPASINENASIWLPGILPVVSYASMQVKPQLLALFKHHVLSQLEPDTLELITKPMTLSLLAGMDDEGSEVFTEIMDMLDEFKRKLSNNSLFWQTLFMCIISNPEKRIGALHWCNSRLPIFTTLGLGEDLTFAAEAKACLTPDPGILARAFASALTSQTYFNQSNDIIVMRGFFDLLITHLPLGSDVFKSTIAYADKELLLMICCRVTLKRDMSLNRRLWTWLLGPEAGDDSEKDIRITYFATHALPVLHNGLLGLIESESANDKIVAYRMALALIMDRWEFNLLLSPLVFVPIIKSCYQAVKRQIKGHEDILMVAKSFFNEVEAYFIWEYLINEVILDYSPESLNALEFLVHNFDFPEEDRALFMSLAIFALLSTSKLNKTSLSMLELLVELTEPSALSPLVKDFDWDFHKSVDIKEQLKGFFSNFESGDAVPPISGSELSALILEYLKDWYIETFKLTEFSDLMSKILSDFLYSIPNNDDVPPFQNSDLIDIIISFYSGAEGLGTQEKNSTVFGLVRLGRYIVKNSTFTQQSRILKIILSNVWLFLVTTDPTSNQVEAVRLIFELELCFDLRHIEAGILELLLNSSSDIKLRSFYKLWTHSVDFNNADVLLSNPLHTVLDDLSSSDNGKYMNSQKFVNNAIVDGSANRLLMLITNPFLSFTFIKKINSQISNQDDLKLFLYHLQTVSNVIKSNEKILKDSFNHEFVVSESTEKIELIKSNDWDISNYKSLMVCLIRKFLSLNISEEMLEDRVTLSDYSSCVSLCLELFCFFFTGSETDFEANFRFLTTRSFDLLKGLIKKPHEIEVIESNYIKAILQFLKNAKLMNTDMHLLKLTEESKNPLLVSFIIHGISACRSSTLLERWMSLLTTSLYMFNESIFSVILTINDALIDKVLDFFSQLQEFRNEDENTDLDACLSILLAGIEDFLSICHSFLVTSNLRAPTQTTGAENGFLGNMIQGVFQIESPAVRTEEQNRLYSILISFRDASRAAFKIWSWADSKPSPDVKFVHSTRTTSYFCTKLKFRSRKLLERLSDLERQEVVETIIESSSRTVDKVKILHVLDGGRAQLTIPRMFQSISIRCMPTAIEEKDMSSLNAGLSYERLSEFLIPYFQSLDSDTINEVWDETITFMKEVLAHSSHYSKLLLVYLEMIKVLSSSTDYKRGSKRNNKELASIFLSTLTAAINNRDLIRKTEDPNILMIVRLERLLEFFSGILQDSDKTSTAVTLIISTFILPEVKKKLGMMSNEILNLIQAIGVYHPIKAWKQIVSEIFMDNAFFTGGKSCEREWMNIIGLWVSNDKDRMIDLITRVTPSIQPSAANIFIWNENSDVEDRVFTLKRISYLLMVQPKDFFAETLEGLFAKLSLALNSTCPPLYKGEAFILFRAITLRFNEMMLHSYWTPIIQSLIEVYQGVILKGSAEFSSMSKDSLRLVLSASKLVDQLLLIGFDEFSLSEWLFVSTVSATELSGQPQCLIGRLGRLTESVLTKEDPVQVSFTTGEVEVGPLLYGTRSIQHIANLKIFFGLLGYINYERKYGLHKANLQACETDTLMDVAQV